MAEQALLVERNDGYAVLTLNRPEARNALSPSLLTEICETFRALQQERDVHGVVLTGAGSAFCAGLDLKAMGDSSEGLGVYDIHGKHDLVGP